MLYEYEDLHSEDIRNNAYPVMQEGAPLLNEICASGVIPETIGMTEPQYAPLSEDGTTNGIGKRIGDIFDAMEARNTIAKMASARATEESE